MDLPWLQFAINCLKVFGIEERDDQLSQISSRVPEFHAIGYILEYGRIMQSILLCNLRKR